VVTPSGPAVSIGSYQQRLINQDRAAYGLRLDSGVEAGSEVCPRG